VALRDAGEARDEEEETNPRADQDDDRGSDGLTPRLVRRRRLGELRDRLDILARRVLQVVHGALEFNRKVLGEDGDVAHARRVHLVDGRVQVRIEVQLVAHVIGRRDLAAGVDVDTCGVD
jgi:hypothetical protein